MCQFRFIICLGTICLGTAIFSLTASLTGCGKSADGKADAASTAAAPQSTPAKAIAPATGARTEETPAADPLVVLHTTQGDITLQLFAEKAPRTVENFLRGYAERGFYDQTIFHHAERGRMLIAGGYTSNMERKPVRAPIYNESRNGLSNRRGTVAMIREPDAPHSATSEFFVNLADNPDFDYTSSDQDGVPGYCVFGEIVSGMDVVDRITQLPTAAQGDFPKVPSPAVAIVGIQRLR